MSLPFDLVGGLVVLRNLELNGQHDDFILGTGCAYGLLVEQAAFAGHLRPMAASGLGVNGAMAQQQLAVSSFQFGATHYAGLQAVATSLADVRRLAGPRLLGLIGTELLREYEGIIDYERRRLSSYPLRTSQGLARLPFVRTDSLRFALVQGKPITRGYVGKVPVQLLIDTGAMTNSLGFAFLSQNVVVSFHYGRRQFYALTPKR